jgi:FlaA1/EpsC-like NDP-sugar epimerase
VLYQHSCSALARLFKTRWQFLQAVIDLLAWAVAVIATADTRYGLAANQVSPTRLLALVLLAWSVHLPVAVGFRLYRGRFQFGSFEEALALVRAEVVTTAVLVTLNAAAVGHGNYPLARPAIAASAALVLMCATRALRRATRERSTQREQRAAENVIIFGAGSGGSQAIKAMMLDPQSRYRPVAILDDDADKQALRIMGVPVVGARESLAEAAARFDAKLLVAAVPSADASLLRALKIDCEAAAMVMQVLPSVGDLVSGRVRVQDIRDVDLNDLLGRHAVEIDSVAIGEHLRGRRVLVTGAGGSIGSELCRVIGQYGPAKLFMLDRDESALHALQLRMTGRALLDSDDLILADIRDSATLVAAFLRVRPDIVFHAAALKHLSMLERYPGEAVKTNVWATLSVLQAAVTAGVGHFVNVSTDKAADPHSVLGYSKRLSERLTSTVAHQAGSDYVSVRFGNVLGSRGSVLTTFKAQAVSGGPITVTDPRVTRYFMTVREAVELMLQASVVSQGGDVLVLDMGEPVRIADVAQRVAATVEDDVEIVYTGLRAGEKLHERMLGSGEVDARPCHPLISQVPVPPLELRDLGRLDPTMGPDSIVSAMRELCYAAPARVDIEDPAALAAEELDQPRLPWYGNERRRGRLTELALAGMPAG